MIGKLVLVVGASGAGKDSVLRYAMVRFAHDGRYVFPRRWVTRAADRAAEDHESVDERAFEELASNGAFALMWEAHGHRYGVRSSINEDLAADRIVAVNVSRTIVSEVACRYHNAVVVEIATQPEVRAARIAARGREVGGDALARTQREIVAAKHSLRVQIIRNEGHISVAGEEFCKLLAGLQV